MFWHWLAPTKNHASPTNERCFTTFCCPEIYIVKESEVIELCWDIIIFDLIRIVVHMLLTVLFSNAPSSRVQVDDKVERRPCMFHENCELMDPVKVLSKSLAC